MNFPPASTCTLTLRWQDRRTRQHEHLTGPIGLHLARSPFGVADRPYQPLEYPVKGINSIPPPPQIGDTRGLSHVC